ncbi:MAG: hypothetical protein F4Z66_06240, partial [Gammaproteobacteria bacterium]|nr:hypothetical protein [Gammaproteobacteria bacterium]
MLTIVPMGQFFCLCLSLGLTTALDILVSFFDWLTKNESGSTTLRNVGLVVAGLIAIPLAVWRSIVAERQAKTAARSLLNDRYQKGVEMVGNVDNLAVRLGGIHVLAQLAREHP